jgi:hypothetical protein
LVILKTGAASEATATEQSVLNASTNRIEGTVPVQNGGYARVQEDA